MTHTMRVNRRRFLKSATAACSMTVAGTLFEELTFASDNTLQKKKTVNFGFSLYGMRSLKTAEALKTCAQIKYDSVELVCTKDWPCDPQTLSSKDRKEIRGQLQDLNLKLPALMENLHVVVDQKRHKSNLDRIQAAGELGHDLSPEHPPVMETVLGGRPQQWEQTKGKMVAGLKDWAKAARKAKTVIAIKAHVGGALHTPDDAKWLVNEVDSPWIKLAYDFSHFQLYDFNLKKSLQAMIDQSVFIHVKDKSGTAEKFQFLLPGDGDIDYAVYFNLLKQSSYRESVMVEVSGQIHGKSGYDPVQAAKHSYANLAPVLHKAGLRNGG
jgi:sugar phosphate isomerase/epimerase